MNALVVRASRPAWHAALPLALAVMAISSSAVLIQAASPAVPALALATWRMVLAALVAGALALASAPARRQLASLDRRQWTHIALAALCLALHFALWVPSVTGTKIVSSVALVTTSPLWVAVLSPRWIGEGVRWQLRAAVALGFTGALTIMLGDALTFGRDHVAADALALGGALAVAGYFMVARQLRQQLRLSAYLTAVYGVTALMLLSAALAAGTPLHGWTARHWVLVAAFALLPQVIGHSTLNWALARLTATFVAAATLFEPVGSALLAWWIFGQVPVPTAWLGGAIVLGALGWATFVELPGSQRTGAAPSATGLARTDRRGDRDAPLR